MKIERRKGTILLCIVILIICSYMYYYTFSFPKEFKAAVSGYGSAFFPRIILIVLAITTTVLLIQSLFLKKHTGTKEMLYLNKSKIIRVSLIWIMSLVFYFGWHYWSFVLISPVFMILIGIVLKLKNIGSFLFLIALGILLYFILNFFLQIGLP